MSINNNASLGFTLQKLICDQYNILPDTEKAQHQFLASYNDSIKDNLVFLIQDLFAALKLKPIQCTTLSKDDKGKDLPFNFILSDNSTLSVRTNFKGSKVAPRIVGQAGFNKLNEYFSSIYGTTIQNQDDIKHLIINKIDLCLPVFFNFLFDADYIVWIYHEKMKYNYCLIRGDSWVDIKFDYNKFSFTRSLNEWVESTTLKYNEKSIAEIQIHKNRTFKFRFIMKNVISLLIERNSTNETLGITAEKTICDMFGLEYPDHFKKRYDIKTQNEIYDCIRIAFKNLPKPIMHCGSNVGIRGGTSKCSYDFLLDGNKTLSLKTNIGKMVCPPEVGQPNDKTCYLYFKSLISEEHIDKIIFKKMVFENITEMLNIYIQHLFDSDYLLRIYAEDQSKDNSFRYEIFEKSLGSDFIWDRSKISFSKTTIAEWNESNTLYYDGISIGEFQVHNNRNCFKFRFNFKNLIEIIKR